MKKLIISAVLACSILASGNAWAMRSQEIETPAHSSQVVGGLAIGLIPVVIVLTIMISAIINGMHTDGVFSATPYTETNGERTRVGVKIGL